MACARNPYKAVPFRPRLRNHRDIRHVQNSLQHHAPIRNAVPQHLPILRPPIFQKPSDLYEEQEELQEQYEEVYPYSTFMVTEQHQIGTEKLATLPTTSLPSQNYANQQLTNRSILRHLPT